MKTKTAVLAMALSLMVSGVNANVLYFYGQVDAANVNPLIKVGDDVRFRVTYNPSTNVVTQASATVDTGVLPLIRSGGGVHVFIDSNPADFIVQWNVMGGSTFSIDVASNTDGTMPCITEFDLGNGFQIFFNSISASGHLTAVPRSRTGN